MKAWLQLMRLPNVFTAVADVMMGYLVTHGSLEPASHFTLLAVASSLLYLSGMVLNDVFDADADAIEQPARPIPSGRIPLREAAAAGWILLAVGTLCGWLVSSLAADWRPGLVATLLAVCIVMYDKVAKRTPLAPVFMGMCRMLNVLLGMSLGLPYNEGSPLAFRLICLGIGLYVAGVTWFARTDARMSSRAGLLGGLFVLMSGTMLLALTPAASHFAPPLRVGVSSWYVLWTLIGIIIARRCILAIYDPSPPRVQAAVRFCVQSIIVVDAAVCVGYISPMWGIAVLALLAPTLLLTSWLQAT